MATEFDDWVVSEYATRGRFTSLVILVDVGDSHIAPLCSTYFNVIGDNIDWEEITVLFAGSGMDWSAAAFFPVTATDGGPIDNPSARARLRALEEQFQQDRLVLNQGQLFDRKGRRLLIEEDLAP